MTHNELPASSQAVFSIGTTKRYMCRIDYPFIIEDLSLFIWATVINTMSWAVYRQHLFLIVCRMGSLRSWCGQILISWGLASWLRDGCLFKFWLSRKGEKAFWGQMYKGIHSIHEGSTIRAYLSAKGLTSKHCHINGLFSTYEFLGDTNSLSIAKPKANHT